MKWIMDKNNSDQTQTELIPEESSYKVALKEAEKSREKLLHTQRLAGIGGFEYLPDEKVIILSDAAIDVLGLSKDTTFYQLDDFCQKISLGLYDKFCILLQRAVDEKIENNIEFVIRDDKKQTRYIEVIIDAPGGTFKGSISGVLQNITRLRQAEITRNVKSQSFEAIFDNAKVAILVLNLKGRVIDFNDSALSLFGYERKEMENMRSTKLLMEEDVKDAAKIFAKFINSAGRLNFVDYRLKKKNGEVFDVLVNFEMIVTSEGEKIYIFVNDISQLKDMERKTLDQERMLVQQSKMATLGEMVALIAHQWQQPINSIAMIVQMLEELIELDDKNRKMLSKSVESVMTQVHFMSGTMDNFRNFLKPSDISEHFKVHRILNDVVDLYRPQLRHYKVECEIFLEDEGLKKAEVFGFENELKNVILNVLTNARDAIEENNPENGKIRIMITEAGENICISIDDNGGGMPQQIMKKIFDPYVSSKGDKGTGLGLYMAKLIINDRMGGDIYLENTKHGLRVVIELKRTDNREAK